MTEKEDKKVQFTEEEPLPEKVPEKKPKRKTKKQLKAESEDAEMANTDEAMLFGEKDKEEEKKEEEKKSAAGDGGAGGDGDGEGGKKKKKSFLFRPVGQNFGCFAAQLDCPRAGTACSRSITSCHAAASERNGPSRKIYPSVQEPRQFQFI